MRRKASFWLVILATCAPQLVRAQAVVNESQETAYLYVDAANGSDSNPGTQAQPMKTISAASAAANTNNYHSIGTQININPGLYRETITILGNQYNTAAPITYQSTGAGVVVSGSVPYTNWQTYSGNTAIYTAPWTNTWGDCTPMAGSSPFEQEIVLRREMIFVNGVNLTQVMSLVQMQPGTFFVSETAGRVYVWPAAGTNMNTSDVEVATLPEVLHVVGRSNLVFRGMSFIHAASCRDNDAVYIAGASKNILFDTDSIRWNNAIGLHFYTPVTNFTVLNTSSSHNGQSGMMSVQSKYGLWQGITTSFNNWRGAQGAYYYWNSGGLHFYYGHDDTVSGATIAYNQTHGVHFDTDNANITVSNALIAQNLAIGIAVEKSEGPVAITNSNFCGNNPGVKYNYIYQSGLLLRNSEFVSLTNSNFYNNNVSQIGVIGIAGGVEITNWETGVTKNLRSQNFTHTGNTVEALGDQEVFMDSYLGNTDWTMFQTTLNSNKNTWWNSSSTSAFEIPVATVHPFSGWQSVTGQDSLSSWTQPADLTAACAVTSAPDYWILVDNPSQTLSVAGQAVFSLEMLPLGGLTGTANITIDGIKEVKGLSGTLSATASPLNGSFTLQVTAAPSTAAGTYPVTVVANLGSRTRTVTASLIIPATSVRLSTASMTFGPQKIKTSSTQSFTLTNYGKTAMALSSITATKQWTQTNNCGSSVAAGTTCTVNVTFTPIGKGTWPGTLQIKDGDPNSPQVIALTGIGD